MSDTCPSGQGKGYRACVDDVTPRALRDGTLLTTPPEMPPGSVRPVFRSAWFAVLLLPGARALPYHASPMCDGK